jgi:HK97 family phage portal protein
VVGVLSVGSQIVTAIRHRIRRSGAVFQGRPVDIFVNDFSSDGGPEGMSPETMWRTQPHLRTVVDFLARNVAQLGLHVFAAEGDERERDRGSDVSRVLGAPNDDMTTYELVYDLVGNLALYNRAYWFIHQGKDGLEIHPFPAYWVQPVYQGYWNVTHYAVCPPGVDQAVKVPADQVVAFAGWNPEPGSESSPVETLRLIMEEQHHARKHRVQLWRNNGRVGSYISRPKDAPTWDGTAKKRFMEMFEAFVGDSGPRAGGSPLLEDGMEIKTTGFKSADEEWAESVKLSLEMVAQVYQVNPTMVGVLDNANYSNVREFNRSLYTNTLGPLLRMIEARMNAFVLPKLGAKPNQFVEFNVEEKLRGSFEDQAEIMSTSIGGPWMTRNEGRRRLNLPPLEGGDELITPLNVSEGGQASPQDGQTGQIPVDAQAGEKAREVVYRHVGRVSRVVTSKGFDKARFTDELEKDLSKAGCDPGLAVPVNDRIETILEEGGSLDGVAFFDAPEVGE